MKMNRTQLRKLIIETMLLIEEKGEHVGTTAKTDEKTADHIAQAIVGPKQHKKPAFKIFPDVKGHSGYDVYVKPSGKVGGGLHGEVIDPSTGAKMSGSLHIEIPGFSGEDEIHLGAEAEISKQIANGNLEIYGRGGINSHISSDHGKIHIGPPEASGQMGVRGTFGKKRKKHSSGHD